jgi:metal-responsive CopG/Arc/MetJ family transcriptional regulator
VKPKYVNVKIPVALASEVDEIIDSEHLGYRSRAEFISEAIRSMLRELSKYGGRRKA